MLQQCDINSTTIVEKKEQIQKLTLLEFAEIFLKLPEASKLEVLGYAKCLYASVGASHIKT